MALILKIALIVLAVTFGLCLFDLLLVGLVYLARVGIEKKNESEEEECIT